MTRCLGPAVDWDAALVEEAVLRAVAGHRLEGRYRIERERCYESQDANERERRFRALAARFFDELELGRPLARAVGRPGSPLARMAKIAVARARDPGDEGAELFGTGAAPSGGEPLAVGLAVTADTLARPERFGRLLERELIYLSDLLDPEFGFDPASGDEALRGPRGQLLSDRYRALWRASVEGRLARAGTGGDEAGARRALLAVMARPSGGFEALFERLWAGPRPAHGELLALAANGGAVTAQAGPTPGSACPLCRFPTHGFELDPDGLGARIVAAIASDFPGWTAAQGLCRQCADLYRARPAAELERTA